MNRLPPSGWLSEGVSPGPVTGCGLTQGHFVLNIDLAPTFADLAGTALPGAEGRSLMPLIRGARPQWRTDFLIEHLATEAESSPTG